MKPNQMIHTLLWNDGAKDAYLYGTDLDITNPYKVKFKNELIPSGSIIKKWNSKTNYFTQRACPSAPMLDNETTYYVAFHCTSQPAGKVYIRINAYDHSNQLLDAYIQYDTYGQFALPQACASYDVQLIQAGGDGLIFESIQISKQPFESEEIDTEKTVHLLSLEPMGNAWIVPEMDLENVSYVYHPHPEVKDIEILKQDCKDIHCIGYGQHSDANAVRIAKEIGAKAYTSQEVTGNFETVYGTDESSNLFSSILDHTDVLDAYVKEQL